MVVDVRSHCRPLAGIVRACVRALYVSGCRPLAGAGNFTHCTPAATCAIVKFDPHTTSETVCAEMTAFRPHVKDKICEE